jgi:hypothetical protein
MKKHVFTLLLFCIAQAASAQNFGILRENYFSSYYDTTLMMNIDVLDSSTIRLGSINPTTGVVSNVGNVEYASGINLSGATIDPYQNRYYIGKGFNFLTFDNNTGTILYDVPITGSLPSSAFQNFRFNNSDSTIYGMVPNNFYSTYYDSTLMMEIEVLDSTQIRFASLNPTAGQYTIIGNSSFSNLYTLAGNSIDPHQMLYYYSAVDTLIGIDLYTGNAYSTVPIQLPPNGIFENIAYSCADTSIYGMTRQNYVSMVYDSLFMDYLQVIDSTTFRLSKINPNTGAVALISPMNLGVGGNLTGGAFIDPNTMTYYFSNGNQIVGVSLVTGLITSSVQKTYPGNAIALDMMRSTQNCFGATKARLNNATGLSQIDKENARGTLFPNPAQTEITFAFSEPILQMEILDARGGVVLVSKEKTTNIAHLPSGIYFAKVMTANGTCMAHKFLKD